MKNSLYQLVQDHARRIAAGQPAFVSTTIKALDAAAKRQAAQAHCLHIAFLLETAAVYIENNLGIIPQTANSTELIASTNGIGGWVYGAFGYADSCLELSSSYAIAKPGAEAVSTSQSVRNLLSIAARVTHFQALMLLICASRLELAASQTEDSQSTIVQLKGWIDEVEPRLSELQSRMAESEIDIEHLTTDACALAAACRELINIWTKYIGTSLSKADLEEAARAFTIAANILIYKMTLLLSQAGEEAVGV